MSKPRKYPPELTRSRILKWCDQKERTHWETREKLMDWGVPHNERESLISELIENQYINEQRYALAFASDKFRFYQWGAVKIEVQLRIKGLSERNIAEAIRSIAPGDYEGTVNKLISRKWNEIKDKDPRIKKQKVFRFLLSKGYESALISKLITLHTNKLRIQDHDD